MFRIITDSSANLPSELIEKYNIEIVPFHYTINGHEHSAYTGKETEKNLKKFYGLMKRGATVKTSMINISEYFDCFEKHLIGGEDVLYIGMSSGISGAMHSAELAQSELSEKYPERTIETVDTKAASLGQGLVVLYAAKLRDAGNSLTGTTMKAKRYTMNMCQFFTVGDLVYLKNGGRISAAAATIGSLLNIRPILCGNEEGKIVMSGKARGRNKVFAMLTDYYRNLHADPNETIGIADADCEDDTLLLKKMIIDAGHKGEIITACYEPVTGSHVGPGTVALFFPGIHR